MNVSLAALMHRIQDCLSKVPRPLSIVLAYLYVFGWDLINYATGYDLRYTIFYAPAFFILTWFVGIRSAFLLAAINSASWYLAGYSLSAIGKVSLVWDTLFRFAVIAIFIYGVQAYKRERDFAERDYLTGLANRHHFTLLARIEIEKCRRYGRPFSVIYMDIDDFKKINDTFGHGKGNDLLVKVARTIRKNIRSTDSAARLGGDEFAILFPETNYESGCRLAQTLRLLLLEAMQECNWNSTFSLGLVTFSAAPGNFNEMIRYVDRIMYQAKKSGKDRIASDQYLREDPKEDDRD